MKKIIFLMCMIITFIIHVSMREKKNQIIYEVPASVVENLKKYYFFSVDSYIDPSNVICVFDDNFDTTSIIFVKIDQSSIELIEFSKASERKLQIGDYQIPILFYSDLRFSNIFNNHVNNGNFDSKFYLFSGYRITFIGQFTSGSILKSGWDE